MFQLVLMPAVFFWCLRASVLKEFLLILVLCGGFFPFEMDFGYMFNLVLVTA